MADFLEGDKNGKSQEKVQKSKLRARLEHLETEYQTPSEMELPGNASNFAKFVSRRLAVLDRWIRHTIHEYQQSSGSAPLPDQSEGDSETEDNTQSSTYVPIKVSKIVGLGLRSVFELIKESRNSHPKLCTKALKALLDVLQGQTPDGLKCEPSDVIDPLFDLLLDLATLHGPESTYPNDGSHLTAIACACLLSLVVVRGDTGKYLAATTAVLMCPRALAQQIIQMPIVLTLLQRSINGVLLGKVVRPERITHGVPHQTDFDRDLAVVDELVRTCASNFLPASPCSSRNSSRSCSASDSSSVDFDSGKSAKARICAKYFHFGYPNDNPEHQDYVPSIEMGYEATNLNRRGRKVPRSAHIPDVHQEESTLATKYPNLLKQLGSCRQNEVDIKMEVFIDEEEPNHHTADSPLQLMESSIAINKYKPINADTATTRIPTNAFSNACEMNSKDTAEVASCENVDKNILKKQTVRRERNKIATRRIPTNENEVVYETINNGAFTPPQTPPYEQLQSAATPPYEMSATVGVVANSINNHQSDLAYLAIPVSTPTSQQTDIDREVAVVDKLVRTCASNFLPASSCSSSNSGSCSASDSSSEDFEWSAKAKVNRRRAKPYLFNDDKRSRKKEQNKNAATRYRMKHRTEVAEIQSKENTLEEAKGKLETKIVGLVCEIKCLKGLMKDFFKGKGLIR